LLGRLAEYVDQLFELIGRLSAERSLREWHEVLGQIVDTFFHPGGEDADDVVALRRMVGMLAQAHDYHAAPVALPVVRAHLATLLAEDESIGGFLAGHVTFCSLKPMRSIPFRVICMLGMDDGAFPRQDSPIAFDLLAEQKQASARSRRDEDRQLFLESLLSARDVFYLSYTGLSAKDNSESPPSVVVSELLDGLAAMHPEAGDDDPRRHFTTHHRLQPFSQAYFRKGGPLFSYSVENGQALAKGAPLAGPCGGAELPPATLDWQALELRTLIAFLCHPAKHFVEKRLGARLPELEEGLSPHEPMELNKLDEWKLARDLAVDAATLAEAGQSARASGVLPAGHFGAAKLEVVRQTVEELHERMKAEDLGAVLPPVALSVAGEDWQIVGTLDSVHHGGQRLFSAWKLKPKDLLRAWLKHLLLNADPRADRPRVTLLFGHDATRRFRPVEGAAAKLGDLVNLLRAGLRKPLPFFPAASEDFARRELRINPREKKDPAASGRELYDKSERDDAYNELCFRHLVTPCDDEWKGFALQVWRPFFEHSEEEKA
jgi:exodeoxyribonuclease V gamma subunit